MPSTKVLRKLRLVMNYHFFINICYSIIIEDEYLSFFNEYPNDLIKKTPFIEKISSLPKDVSEIFTDKEHLINHRITGLFPGYTIKFCNDLIEFNNSPYRFNVVFSSSEDAATYNPFVLTVTDKIESDALKNIINICDLNSNHISEWVAKNYANLCNSEKNALSQFRDMYKDHERAVLDVDFDFLDNFYTRVNMRVLESIQLRLRKYKATDYFQYELSAQQEAVDYINIVRSHIREVFATCQNSAMPVDYLISDTSNNLDFLLDKNSYSANALRHEGYKDEKLLEKTIKAINQNKLTKACGDNYYLKSYIDEKILTDCLISLRCASFVTPNIKLSIANSQVVSKLVILGNCDRSMDQKKISKIFSNLLYELNSKTDDWYNFLNAKYYSKIKLVSNLPLEWTIHNGLPLMIRHEVSRIPVSPGYISTKLLTDTENLILTPNQLCKIKIISSFKEGDPIASDLKNKLSLLENLEVEKIKSRIKTFEELTKRIDPSELNKKDYDLDIKFHSVKNREELILCLNDEPTAITIFDLHGGHTESKSGFISLIEEDVSIDEIINEVEFLSPIIVLSACDTNPIDRNHANTANAFLKGGSKTVLASALPVISHESSVFIFRLLLRIKSYLPRVMESSSLRWSNLVTGMLRRSYYTELAYLLRKKKATKVFSDDEFTDMNFKISILLDPLHDDWHEKIMGIITDTFQIDIKDLEKFINDNFMMPECLKYIQIGNPDLILIESGEHIKFSK